MTLRSSRLLAEREALEAVAPHAVDRLRTLDLQLRLELVAQRPDRGRAIGRP